MIGPNVNWGACMMAIRDILVHIKTYEDWSHHIEIAAALAKTHNARLTGLCTLRDIAVLKLILGRIGNCIGNWI